jgi:arylsulfatase A-like enzyme
VQESPNILFILADDLGWTDLGCQGSRYYLTPAIDRLAAEGMRFTAAYTAGPNCQPTRAALMSGQYPPRTGVYTVGGTDRFDTSMRPLVPVENITRLSPQVVTVAEALKAAGYVTGHFGKWHLGDDGAHHPAAQGFDEAWVSMGKHFNFITHPRTNVPAGVYLADFLTDLAVNFIQRYRAQRWFLYLPHFVVHSPWEAPDSDVDRFRNRPAAGGHSNAVYAAMISRLDVSVDRLMRTLDAWGLTSNTVVIFSSDNGGVGGYEREGLGHKDITDNAPLRHGKGSLYEGGIRVPFIVRWPGRIPPGSVCAVPIHSVDLYPTLLSLAHAPAPTGQVLDGVDISPLWWGGAIPNRMLFWHFPGYLGSGHNQWRTTPVSVIRDDRYKLMEFLEDGHLELYDLDSDLSERTNLAEREPELAQRLLARLNQWRKEIQAPMPTRREAPVPPARERGRRRSRTS